jgi:hypothetical protein
MDALGAGQPEFRVLLGSVVQEVRSLPGSPLGTRVLEVKAWVCRKEKPFVDRNLRSYQS